MRGHTKPKDERNDVQIAWNIPLDIQEQIEAYGGSRGRRGVLLERMTYDIMLGMLAFAFVVSEDREK